MSETRGSGTGARIFGLSVLILFLEMLLIRWIATEVRVFSYLQNGILVAAFLGLGLGARNASRPARLLHAVLALAALVLVVRDPLGWGLGERVTHGLTAFKDSVIWLREPIGEGWPRLVAIGLALVVTLGLLFATALTFHPLGQRLGRWMDSHPRPVAAYSLNILGSLVGIALFDAATLARTPPWVWLVASAVGLAWFAHHCDDARRFRIAAAAIGLTLPLFAWEPGGSTTVWSPYQKLVLKPNVETLPWSGATVECGKLIEVNSAGYQALVALDPAKIAARPDVYPPGSDRLSHYVLPYELIGQRDEVLVVGAGAGNDVAGALRSGARHIRAVEIDPVIAEWGRLHHPDSPYSSDRVELVVEDARAFFTRDHGRYDLVWFGLLDSHTTPSAYSNVRLDHYVYTRESFADMKRLLTPDGVVALFFAPETEWIAYRLANLMAQTFGEPPLAMGFGFQPCLGWGGLLLLGGPTEQIEAMREHALQDPELRKRLIAVGPWPAQSLATDDWPYLYLESPGLPRYHMLVGACCLLIGLALRRRLFRQGEDLHVPMLLLGAGFMLLEVTGVSRAALLFGTTWTVNAYVVGAVLGMILLANLTVDRFRPDPFGWPFVGLLASLLLLALAPLHWLTGLDLALRIPLGGAFFALPVYFSGIAFVSLWAAAERRDLALGSNLLGSLLGGVLSMLTMVVGFRSVALLTLACYLAALLAARRRGDVVTPA